MPAHEYYEEMCALAAAGQLSGNELSELDSHLRMCPSCRRASSDFSLILGQLPCVDVTESLDELAFLQSSSYRERFLKRAEAEGIHLSDDVRQSLARSVRTISRRAWGWGMLAASAAAIVLAASWQIGNVVRPEHRAPQLVANASLNMPKPPVVARDSEGLIRKIRALEQKSAALNDDINAVSRERDLYRSQTESDREVAGQLSQRIEQLQSALARGQGELEQAKGENNRTVAALLDSQIQLSDLKEQLKARDTAIEHERQLSAAAKDVRQLMGARNLHIIDVADVDSRGRFRKAFGRVFFVENESLIFYAFDLSPASQSAQVHFQAWGQLEGSRAKPRSLGVFRLDDHAQRRWVLRVDDPKLLAGIDSLFVTVESHPQLDRPSGRKLVYAYLGTEPNHP